MPIMSEPVAAAAPAAPEFAAFVAIDWAEQQHCWKLFSLDSGQFHNGELKNTPEAIEVWAAELNLRFGGRSIAVAIEQRRGPVVARLSKYPHLVLYPVHPTTLARFREAFFPSGSKGDPGDTGLLLDILRHHRDRLRRLDPDTPETRLLQMLVEQRRRLVNERTRQSNRLRACLKMHFPQALAWVDDIDSALGLDFLERWPTLERLQQTKPNTLHRFYTEHNSRSEDRIQRRINEIYEAVPATTDTAMLTAGAAIVAGLVSILKALRACIDTLDQQIDEAVAAHPEAPLFGALPGAGPVLRSRLISAFGTQRERYSSAAELQAYCGIAPVQRQSGHSCTTHFRHACPKFLRQTFHEYASHSVAKSAWARAFYQSGREKGKGHHTVVRALAFKWIRILYHCWKTKTPYDEQLYLRSLRRSHSPLSNILGGGTQLGWQKVAGFHKPCAKPA
jgi:transposase